MNFKENHRMNNAMNFKIEFKNERIMIKSRGSRNESMQTDDTTNDGQTDKTPYNNKHITLRKYFFSTSK